MDNLGPNIPQITHDDLAKQMTVPLSDEDLDELTKVALRLRSDPMLSEAARGVVGILLLAPLLKEGVDRDAVFQSLEIAFEANGHEVWLCHDGVLKGQGEPAWFVACHCTADVVDEEGREFFDTEAEARATGQRHIDEHGGRWEPRDQP